MYKKTGTLFVRLNFIRLNFIKLTDLQTGILGDSTIYKCSPDSDSEISLKIYQYLMKLRRTKQGVLVFLCHPVISNRLCACGRKKL